MNLAALLVIAVGGAIGSVCRYLMASGVQKVAHFAFPIGTLTVNIIGSMIVGLISGYIMNMQTHPLAIMCSTWKIIVSNLPYRGNERCTTMTSADLSVPKTSKCFTYVRRNERCNSTLAMCAQ